MSTPSAAAQIVTNTDAALSTLAAQVEQLRTTTSAMQSEYEQAQSDFAAMHSRRHDLHAHAEALQADLRRASLEAEMSTGTAKEAENATRQRDIASTLTAALEDLHAQELIIAETDGAMDTRIRELGASIETNQQALLEMERRRYELTHIRDQAHAQHGREVYRQALAELAALEERLAIEQKRVDRVERKLAGCLAHLHERFDAWPELREYVRTVHAPMVDDAASRLLTIQRTYLEALEREFPALPHDPGRPNFIVGSNYNLWELLGLSGNDARLLYAHGHMGTSPERMPVLSFETRKLILAKALREHDLSKRHTTASEHERITGVLAKLATVAE